MKAGNAAFILLKNKEVTIISDYTKATEYPSFGDAMKVAATINNTLNSAIVRVVSFYK